MRGTKAKDKMNLVLIDFKGAYNTINRRRLFKILDKKGIFGSEELRFFE